MQREPHGQHHKSEGLIHRLAAHICMHRVKGVVMGALSIQLKTHNMSCMHAY